MRARPGQAARATGGQKVFLPKTMVEREIELVQGLVPISQPLNAKGARRMGGWGRAFLLHFPFHSAGSLAPSLPPAGLNLLRAFEGVPATPYLSHPFKALRGGGRGRGGAAGAQPEAQRPLLLP